ncbi:acetate kinase [Marinilabiliaceae bacterium JC017]|nr:acetate kinase [Marinilabiliaceae bacterium JC017]
MIILVLNCGSSSIKFQLFDLEKQEQVITKGIVERIGINGGCLKRCVAGATKVLKEQDIPDHTIGIQLVLDSLVKGEYPVLSDVTEINAVGHRVVHGAEVFSDSVIIDEAVKEQIMSCSDLAPLHNPANLKGIMSLEAVLPGVPQIAVFDTSFHQTMPDYAYLYGIPYSYYEKYKIRRYGFHGVSHKYVAEEACRLSNKKIKNSKIITCHLGNGASMAAIENGVSVDTTMGFTPVAGLMMGTRCGTIDPGILLYLEEKEHLSISGINRLINKESGLQGISGLSSDMRDVEKAADEGIYRAELALKMYTYRIRKWIGAFTAIMNGVDLVVFTGGVGENRYKLREKVCENLSYLGIKLDKDKNIASCGEDSIISSSDSSVSIAVIKTDEELVIARETLKLIRDIK